MAKEVDAARAPVEGAAILRRVDDVSVPLERLREDANLLRQLGDAAGAVDLGGTLTKIGRHVAELDQRVARLAPHTEASVSDVAGDLAEVAEALVTRWDSHLGSRRESLVERLLARCAELAAVLVAITREVGLRETETPSAAAAPRPTPQPRAARPPRGSAAQAWEDWNLGTYADGADVCLRLSQSWIEGTGAQLSRDERLRSSEWSNASEVTDRLRHHLALLAGGEPVSYMDALATARHRVVEELRGSDDDGVPSAIRRSEPTGVAGRRRARPKES